MLAVVNPIVRLPVRFMFVGIRWLPVKSLLADVDFEFQHYIPDHTPRPFDEVTRKLLVSIQVVDETEKTLFHIPARVRMFQVTGTFAEMRGSCVG